MTRDTSSRTTLIPTDDVPETIMKSPLGTPEDVFLDPSGGHPEIWVVQGGGFGHWGLIIGKRGDVIRDQVTAKVFRLADGIYYFEQKDPPK